MRVQQSTSFVGRQLTRMAPIHYQPAGTRPYMDHLTHFDPVLGLDLACQSMILAGPQIGCRRCSGADPELA
jgi:hypothetical protein